MGSGTAAGVAPTAAPASHRKQRSAWPGAPLSVGSEVTIGHNATLHGCTVEDLVLIGMGAIVLNGARVGRY
jgi:carbonic anhydrase/acetyltransferase-like protein (isoleucine patch superfamily)